MNADAKRESRGFSIPAFRRMRATCRGLIEAMELAGATILLNHAFASKVPKAIDYWRRALQLGQMETKGSGSINKTPLKWRSGAPVE